MTANTNSSWLFVGLGNPGPEYALHRHNVGFMALDVIAQRHHVSFSKKFQAQFSEITLNDQKIYLLKPQDFMNRSGAAVQAAMQFFKIKPEHVVVFHDELAIEPGRIKYKLGGGHAGHNGLRDIMNRVGQNFKRVRIGIGHPGDKNRVSGYVLQNFSKQEQTWLPEVLSAIEEASPLLLETEDAKFTTEIAIILRPLYEEFAKKQKD